MRTAEEAGMSGDAKMALEKSSTLTEDTMSKFKIMGHKLKITKMNMLIISCLYKGTDAILSLIQKDPKVLLFKFPRNTRVFNCTWCQGGF